MNAARAWLTFAATHAPLILGAAALFTAAARRRRDRPRAAWLLVAAACAVLAAAATHVPVDVTRPRGPTAIVPAGQLLAPLVDVRRLLPPAPNRRTPGTATVLAWWCLAGAAALGLLAALPGPGDDLDGDDPDGDGRDRTGADGPPPAPPADSPRFAGIFAPPPDAA